MRSIRRAVGEALMFATEPRHAVQNPKCGAANVVARGPCMLYIPRWPWHAAVELGEEFFYPNNTIARIPPCAAQIFHPTGALRRQSR